MVIAPFLLPYILTFNKSITEKSRVVKQNLTLTARGLKTTSLPAASWDIVFQFQTHSRPALDNVWTM
jgi:hypothetical protein